MDDRTPEESELRLIRAQLESLARQYKRQVEIFEKISTEVRDIRGVMVVMLIIFLLTLLIYALRSGIL
jgi:hypothetical protein